MSALRVDLNCDLGEVSTDPVGHDEEIMRSISSANVACGLHAGDPTSIRRTVDLALRYGVHVGAHPGFPDRDGFGRRPMRMSPGSVEDLVFYQLGALGAILSARGGCLSHVKPHGALYNMASSERSLADEIAAAVRRFDPSLVLYGLSGSCVLEAGRALGLCVASEVFADRAYRADASLLPRREPGSVITDINAVIDRSIQMVTTGRAQSCEGGSVGLQADTICVHGDTSGAVELAARLRVGLEKAGIDIVPASESV